MDIVMYALFRDGRFISPISWTTDVAQARLFGSLRQAMTAAVGGMYSDTEPVAVETFNTFDSYEEDPLEGVVDFDGLVGFALRYNTGGGYVKAYGATASNLQDALVLPVPSELYALLDCDPIQVRLVGVRAVYKTSYKVRKLVPGDEIDV